MHWLVCLTMTPSSQCMLVQCFDAAVPCSSAFYISSSWQRVRCAQVAQSEAAHVAHLSLIEVGGIRLLLLLNAAALRRLAQRSAAFSV